MTIIERLTRTYITAIWLIILIACLPVAIVGWAVQSIGMPLDSLYGEGLE